MAHTKTNTKHSTKHTKEQDNTTNINFSIFFISDYLFIKITKTINDLINIKLQMAVFCIQMTPPLNVHAKKNSCLVPLSNQYHEKNCLENAL